VYLGAAPGVGKTFKMLDEGNRRRERGTDVVVAFVESHGRALTAERIGDLPELPRLGLGSRSPEVLSRRCTASSRLRTRLAAD
jgi:two-component system sensor histidine kinase KdpD